LHQTHGGQPFQQAGYKNDNAHDPYHQHHESDDKINLTLERRLDYLESAGRRRELIGEALSPNLFGFKIACSGYAETAGEELIPGPFAD
jgi:hypothetical protein